LEGRTEKKKSGSKRPTNRNRGKGGKNQSSALKVIDRKWSRIIEKTHDLGTGRERTWRGKEVKAKPAWEGQNWG